MLFRSADYIRQLRCERGQLKDEIGTLRAEIETLNSSINNVQSLLPASGAPVSHQRSTRMREMFDEYTRLRTQHNWKFWVVSFSKILLYRIQYEAIDFFFFLTRVLLCICSFLLLLFMKKHRNFFGVC